MNPFTDASVLTVAVSRRVIMHVESSCASSYIKRNSCSARFAGSRQRPIKGTLE